MKYDKIQKVRTLKDEKEFFEGRGLSDKNGNLMELANGYEIPMIKKDEKSDGKESGETGEPQENKIRRRFRIQREFGCNS